MKSDTSGIGDFAVLTVVLACLAVQAVFTLPAYGDEIVDWGYYDEGQETPPEGNDFIAITGGHYYSLALRTDGSIAGWGWNAYGLTSPPIGNDFAAVDAGQRHSLALKSDGSIVGWGDNTYGQTTPPPGNDFIAIAAGGYHSLALKSDRSIVGRGAGGDPYNSIYYNYGQAMPPAGNDFVAIAAGTYHSLALKSDGSIVGWGDNTYGQALPPAGNDFTAIAAGSHHGLALRADGSIAGWGWNAHGQASPPAGNDFIAITAGWGHSLALRADGSIIGWGNNVYNSQATPPTRNDFTAVAAGSYHSVALVFAPQNSPPVADAGPDQTPFVTELVILDGSGSTDLDGDQLTFLWSFISRPSGSTATLSDSTAVDPTFVVDEPGTYVVQLIVNDGKLDSAADTVTISTLNSPPVTDAGPDQSGYVGDTITLDGSGSTDVDGDPLTHAWSLTTVPEGSTAALSDPTGINPTFVIDAFGTYVAQLIVNDGTVDSEPDTVTISTLNSAPVAEAGPGQSGYVGDTITLDGGGSSDVDGDPLTHTWSLTTIPEGSTAALSDPTGINPTFVIDAFGTYVAQLIVNDGTVDSEPDTVTISTLNSAPVAEAGPSQSGYVGDTITLDGGGSSDVDGDPLTHTWSLTTIPEDSTAALSDPTGINPTFVIDAFGTYVAQLIVNDGTVDSEPDTVTISTLNSAPAAEAGPGQSGYVGDTITLDGGGSSDVDGDPLTHTWSLTTIPEDSTAALSDPTGINPTFVIDAFGTYVAQLIVNDGTVDSEPDTVTISTLNSAPAAEAGPGQSGYVGDTITLDGGGSSDVDGDPLTYAWSLTTVPAGSAAVLSDPTAATPTFDVDLPGIYVAQLIVNDGSVNSMPDTVSITAVDLNDAPVIESISAPLDPVQVATVVTATADFSDPDVGDTHTASWDWEDGDPSPGIVNEGEQTVTGTNVYDLPGVYTLKLSVTDAAGESDERDFEYIVVYDPEGGFVTGGGWIDSPAGAYVTDTSLAGKASFGFVSKYKKGASVPTGNTEFQFKAGDLDFHSSSYDWLVVTQNGSNAQFKGWGTINGQGSYRFMIWAGDHPVDGDTFRIRIWEEDDAGNEMVVYDNGYATDQRQPIGGGSIVIHTK